MRDGSGEGGEAWQGESHSQIKEEVDAYASIMLRALLKFARLSNIVYVRL